MDTNLTPSPSALAGSTTSSASAPAPSRFKRHLAGIACVGATLALASPASAMPGTNPTSWPSVVQILENGVHVGSGVLVDSTWVLTAAQIIDQPVQSYSVVVTDATGDCCSEGANPGGQAHGLVSYVKHPGFEDDPLRCYNLGLALLELAVPVSAPPVPVMMSTSSAPLGSGAAMVSWAGPGACPDVFDVQIGSSNCASTTGNLSLSNAGGAIACTGEPGSGIFIEQGGCWELAGIVSFGPGGEACLTPSDAGVAQDVGAAMPWILSNSGINPTASAWCPSPCATTTCSPAIARAGDEDSYGSPGGFLDTVAMRPAFAAYINKPGGNNDVYHGGQSLLFDTTGTLDWDFGHSFMNLPQITTASLTIGVRSTEDSENDRINLQFDGVSQSFSWNSQFGPLETLVGGDGVWSNGDEMTLTLDLANLPSGTLTNLVPSINANGYLDVRISDDTDIDYVKLSYCEVTQPGPIFDGNSHTMLGSATASVTVNGIQVSNIGASGQDGVDIKLPPINIKKPAFATSFSQLDGLPAGGNMSTTSMGSYNGAPVHIGTGHIKSQPGGGWAATASFPGTDGLQPQMLEVYNAGQLVFQGWADDPTAIINPDQDGCWTVKVTEWVQVQDANGNWVNQPTVVFKTYCNIAVLAQVDYIGFALAPDPSIQTTVIGDEIVFYPAGQGTPPATPTNVAIRADGIPSFTIESEVTYNPFIEPVNLGGGATPACGAGCSSMELTATGGPPLVGNSSFGLELVNAPDAGYFGLWLGFGGPTAGFSWNGGTFYASVFAGLMWGSISPVIGTSGCSGSASIALPLPNDTNLIGFQLTPQGFFVCPTGENVPTNALLVTIQ